VVTPQLIDVARRVAFSPDGQWLASGSTDQRVLILGTKFTRSSCDWFARNLSRREWERYLPAYPPYSENCPGQPLRENEGHNNRAELQTSPRILG
jgi:hypothetical protein